MAPLRTPLLVALLGLALLGGAALAWNHARDAPAALDPAAHHAAASPGPGFTLDYTLYGLRHDGEEVLIETTRYAEAVEANRSGLYRLREEALYAPRAFNLSQLERPASVADFVLAKLDAAGFAPGQEIDVLVPDAVAPDAEMVRGEVPRRNGPFPTRYSLGVEEYEATTGRAPVVGDEVNTTATFSAFVERVEGDDVWMRVNVEDGGAIVSRPLATLFRIEFSEDGREFWMVLHPVRDSIFRLPVENRVLGLQPGNYMWTGLTDETAAYESHPVVSPIYVGVDFRLRATVIETTQVN